MKKITLFVFAFLFFINISNQGRAEEAPSLNGFLKKGIRFETQDGNYSLAISPKMQLRYAYANREGAANDAQSIMVRRVYLGFEGGFLTPDLTYNVTLNGIVGGTAANILYYANLNYHFSDAAQIKAGLHKLAFNRSEMTGDGKQQFIERSLANERFNLDRGIGLVLWGQPWEKKFEYYFTLANGRATNANLNANQEMAYIARFAFNPLGDHGYAESDWEDRDQVALTLGVAGEYHTEEPTVSLLEDDVMTGSADVGFKCRGFSFQGEGFWRRSDPGATAVVQDVGFYAQAGYFVIPKKVELAARASMLFDDLSDNGGGVYFDNGSLTGLGGVNDGVDEGADADNEQEYSAVINYFIKGYNLKLQAQYSFILDGVAGANDVVNHLGMVQGTLEF